MLPDNSSSLVEVKQSPLHGRGLYAVKKIPAGTKIGTWPVLILNEEDTDRIRHTRLYHYVFFVDETSDGRMRTAVAFGAIAMCNHSTEANAVFDVTSKEATVTLSAKRDIEAGEEILIDYGDFASEAV